MCDKNENYAPHLKIFEILFCIYRMQPQGILKQTHNFKFMFLLHEFSMREGEREKRELQQ